MNLKITEILRNVDASTNWSKALREIRDWADVIENPHEPVEERVNAYFQEILPLQWKAFCAHNQYRKTNNELILKARYDVGIFLVGFSEVPIILSLAALQPREIYFLYSKESQGSLQWIPKGIEQIQPDLTARVEVAVRDSQFALSIDNSSDPVETFKRIKEVVQAASGKSVAIDITGGKKTMNSGGFTAGSIWPDCDLFYIDHREYDERRRRPVYGTEFLSKLDSPYKIYDIQSHDEGKALFQKHNYEAAEALLTTVHKNLSDHADPYGLEQEQHEVENLLKMATCYRFWDALNYKDAQTHKGTWGYQKQHTISDIIDVLDILSEVDNKITLFADEKRVIHFAIDRHQNGLRRLNSGRFEDAIVRFTQIVEILSNYKIYKLANSGQLDDGTGHKVTAREAVNERWGLSNLIRLLFNHAATYTSYAPYRILDTTHCLQSSDYSFTVGEMLKFIDARNAFVHVKAPVARADAINLKDLSAQLLKNFSKDYCLDSSPSFSELLALHRFKEI